MSSLPSLSRSFHSAGVFGFCVMKGSMRMFLPPGVVRRKADCPSHSSSTLPSAARAGTPAPRAAHSAATSHSTRTPIMPLPVALAPPSEPAPRRLSRTQVRDCQPSRAYKRAEDALAYEARIDRVVGSVEECRVPVIAAIAGACTGGGAGIAAACDLRIAAANARFGFPIARTLGNCLSMGNLSRLAALIGIARAKEIIFTARLVEAAEALGLGLVREVLPDHPAP